MKTLSEIARIHGCSKSYVRKLHLQGRLTSKGERVIAERVGNILTFPDDTALPTARAAYGTLKK